MTPEVSEIEAIEGRYERRRVRGCDNRYSPIDPYVMMSDQEKDRALVRTLRAHGLTRNISDRTLLEIGCGGGSNLLRFLRLGFSPKNVVGNDLLPDRIRAARLNLPPSIRLRLGDATSLEFTDETFDVVCLFTVFSSILDDQFQQRLAAKAWSLVKPDGGVLWYDFIYDNPSNADVRGVPIRRLRELFPNEKMHVQRVTLAPPIGRLTTPWWSGSYSLLNQLPMLRSHVLVWISKND